MKHDRPHRRRPGVLRPGVVVLVAGLALVITLTISQRRPTPSLPASYQEVELPVLGMH